MIESVSIRNFQSFGNAPIVFHFTKGLTLIIGDNGCGKSTIYDAVFFALFGISFRKAKKSELVNEKNGKNLEIILKLGEYFITRTLDEIQVKHRGDIWPRQSQKEMQDRIELEIIKCNASYVRQTMILGSSLHVPFFRLEALDRRRVLEALINLTAVSFVETKIKKQLTDVKKSVDAANVQISSLKQRLIAISKADAHNSTLESESKKVSAELKSKAQEVQSLSRTLRGDIDPEIASKVRAMDSQLGALKSEKQSKERLMAGIAKGFCNTCLQNVKDEHRNKVVTQIQADCQVLIEKISEQERQSADLMKLYDIAIAQQRIQQQVASLKHEITQMVRIKANLVPVSVDDMGLQEIQAELADVEAKCNDDREIVKACDQILDVIRSGAVRETMMKSVVAKIQTKINKNLQACGFKGVLKFDTDGSETITYRQVERSYGLHSAGERARIDLAVMLAMRSYSIEYGGANLGILILDEIADSSLDYDGLTGILSMLDDDPQAVVIISHHPGNLIESADRVVTVSKDAIGFSKLEIS